MQSQLIFLIALVAGCTAVTSDANKTPEQRIPKLWVLSILNTLGVDRSQIRSGTVVYNQGRNSVQLKDGRLMPIDLAPLRTDGIEDDVNMDVNVRLNLPLDIGIVSSSREPTRRSMKFLPSQSFVYMSKPGDIQTLPCGEIDYSLESVTLSDDKGSYLILFPVRKASECL